MSAFDRFFDFLDQVRSLPKAMNNLSAAMREKAKRTADKEECAQQQRGAEHKDQMRVQRWIALGTWAAFLAAAVYAGISYNQWQEAHRQTVNSARAWVGFRLDPATDLPFVIDDVEAAPTFGVAFHYSVENFGNGPALKVVTTKWVVTDMRQREDDTMAAFICDSAKEFATGTVPLEPNVPNPGPLGYTLFPKQTFPDEDVWHDPKPGLKWAYVMACVAYLDQFRRWHWTRACTLIGDGKVPISNASPKRLCTIYNDTDETGNRGR